MNLKERKSLVREHIDRCIELYGAPIDADFSEAIDRNAFEQMRADMMLLVGIASAMMDLFDE